MEKQNHPRLDKIYAGYSILTKICNAIGIIAVYVMMFLIVIDVFFRNFMPFPLQGIYEIVQWFLLPISCISFFGYAYACGIMPRVTMAVERLPAAARHWISCVVLVLSIGIFGLMSYAAYVYAIKQMTRGGVVTIGTEHVAVWPLYFLIILAFVMVVVECIFALIKNLLDKDRNAVTYLE